MRHLDHEQEPEILGAGDVVLTRGSGGRDPGVAKVLRRAARDGSSASSTGSDFDVGDIDAQILQVASEPSGLPVYVNGMEVGTTPISREVPSGQHTVEVRGECYERTTRRVRVEKGKDQSVELRPEPVPAGLEVRASDQAGNAVKATVKVDGEKVGTTPGRFEVSACASKLQVTLGGNIVYEDPLQLTARETANVRAVLKRGEALVEEASEYDSAGELHSALKLYVRVYNQYPDDPLAGYALYRAAINYETLFEYAKAIRMYMNFYKRYDQDDKPKNPVEGFSVAKKRKVSLKSAGLLSERMQRYTKAASLYQQFIGAYPNAEDAAALQWRAIECWERAGQTKRAFDAIETYRRKYGTAENLDRVFEGITMIADYHRKRNDRDEATEWYEDLLETYEQRDRSQAEKANFYAAKAQFMLANYEFEDWDNINGSLKQQKRKLDKKLKVAKEVQKSFDKVFQYKSLEWTLAANYRVGSLYQQFAEALLYDVPIPFEPGSEEYNIYIIQLEDVAIPLEDKAIARYESNIQTASDQKVVNEWTKKTLEQLNIYMPDKYPLYKEERKGVIYRDFSGGGFLDFAAYGPTPSRTRDDHLDKGEY
jgi:tetratricopeptide (TPR) repeat protein